MRRRTIRVFAAAVAALSVLVVCGSAALASPARTHRPKQTNAKSFLAQAKAVVKRATAPPTKWHGPKTGPKAQKNKTIVCIGFDQRNDTSVQWCDGVLNAAKAIGWKASVIDGKGTADGQRAAILQAIAQKPDGIVLGSVDAASQSNAIAQGAKQGIVFDGIHSAAFPGPYPKLHLFTNITSNAHAIGKTLADYAIVNSNGKAHAVVIYDALYAIARAKSRNMVNQFKACKGCKVLLYDNFPIANASTQFAGHMSSLLQRFSGKVYFLSISDYYFDYAAPALKVAGIPQQGRVVLLGTDGSPATYQRIRTGEYELGTIPEPERMQGWQAVDELNRAFAHKKWSGFVPPVHIVNKSNVKVDVTKQNYYNPRNNYEGHYKKIWGVK